MTNNESSVSTAARMGGTLGMAAAVLVVAGAGGAALGALPPFGGFLLMVLGLGVALMGTVTSIVGIVATSAGKNRGGRDLAVRGLLLCLITVIALAVPASKGSGLPRINDITTDVGDPPVFVSALEAEPNQGRDMKYPGEEFAAQQQAGYPDLASLVLEEEPAAAYDRVRAALAGLPRMQITGESREEGRIEGTETSRLFRFADDVVVRIRPFQDGGSRVDVRSKSRDGKGDLGVNAARIRELLSRVKASAPAAKPATAPAPAAPPADAPAAGS
ncbi:MAG: DUF1499 domain-containing protein [Candidatus Binatia bacterium]